MLDDLNEEQRGAATASMHRPAVVLAGAGTGKTTTVTARLAWLVDEGLAPDRLLLLTFTRRAAREMVHRARQRLGPRSGGTVVGGTFHSVAHRLVRFHAEQLGLHESFTILDPSDAADLVDVVREDLGCADGTRRFPRKTTLVDIYSRTVNTQRPLSDVLTTWFPWCSDCCESMAEVFRTYVAEKRRLGLLDFDDLLLYWAALVGDDRTGRHITSRFDHVLVDEYQDVNAIQVAITDALAAQHRGLTVVGDDMQAIYSFRAADPSHLTDFPSRHPDAQVLRLECNYRSTRPILELSNTLAERARPPVRRRLRASRPGGCRAELVRCRDEAGEATAVADAIVALHEEGLALREQAVLVRTAHHSDLLELELARRHVPFVKYGGLRYLDTAHVKDFLAALRAASNVHDTPSWFRLLQLLDGIGPARARRIIDELACADVNLADAWPTPSVPESAREAGSRVLRAIRPSHEVRAGAHAELVLHAIEPLIRARYPHDTSRLDDLRELAAAASGFVQLVDFVSDLVLDGPRSSGDLAGPPHLDDDYLVISTIHSAKGLEWDAVHVLRVTDGAIPSDMALSDSTGLDEERRVFYVALTRARRVLRMSAPDRYYHRPNGRDDAYGYTKLSRFLDAAVLEHADTIRSAEPDPLAPAALGASPPSRRVEIDLDALWR